MNDKDQCYDSIIANLMTLQELDNKHEEELKNKLTYIEYKYDQLINGLEKLIQDLKYN